MQGGRPLVLLPPSKGQAPGGEDPAYGRVVDLGPLGEPRRVVLDALAQAARVLADPALQRLAGVKASETDNARAALAALAGAATMPAHRRYTGVVHTNAGLADADPRTVGVDVRVVSPLLGLVALHEAVPAYRLELARVPGVGGLATYWRDALADEFRELARDRVVWDLLPGEHERVWPVARRGDAQVHRVRFERPDGRAANAARTKLAKGRLVAAMLHRPVFCPQELIEHPHVALDEGWQLEVDGSDLRAVWCGG